MYVRTALFFSLEGENDNLILNGLKNLATLTSFSFMKSLRESSKNGPEFVKYWTIRQATPSSYNYLALTFHFIHDFIHS